MTDPIPVKLLTFPNADEQVLSIRAKALVFHDPGSKEMLARIDRIAASQATVLIIGETGTGKELVARHIHDISGRSGPFVAVNCGAFSDNLVEAELFGHEAGAFTGAQQARPGWFEVANGGTLFLDEIGDMPLHLQVKMLRVLQERQVARIGSRKALPIDVRLIAATNVDLDRAVAAGHFRRDLYYRLNVAPFPLPPLRERRGNIMPLAHHFIEVYGRKLGIKNVTVSPAAERLLLAYEWPGNIRELENVIHFGLIMCHGQILEAADLRLPGQGSTPDGAGRASSAGLQPVDALVLALRRLLESEEEAVSDTVDRLLLTTAFDHCSGNQVRTAKRLGISRNILRAQLKRFGMLGSGGDTGAETETEADAAVSA
jgi:sigma-54-specific transcriptional regulator